MVSLMKKLLDKQKTASVLCPGIIVDCPSIIPYSTVPRSDSDRHCRGVLPGLPSVDSDNHKICIDATGKKNLLACRMQSCSFWQHLSRAARKRAGLRHRVGGSLDRPLVMSHPAVDGAGCVLSPSSVPYPPCLVRRAFLSRGDHEGSSPSLPGYGLLGYHTACVQFVFLEISAVHLRVDCTGPRPAGLLPPYQTCWGHCWDHLHRLGTFCPDDRYMNLAHGPTHGGVQVLGQYWPHWRS